MEQVEARAPGGLPARIGALRGFLQHVQAEMKKVTWPSRSELAKATRIVVILSFVLGIVIGLVDWILQLILVRGVAAIAQ